MPTQQDYVKLKDQLTEQTISKQVTVATGAIGVVEIPVQANAKAFLKGYGHTFKNSTSYQLGTGYVHLPKRTDQEGSIAQPVIYGNPFPLKPSAKLELRFYNETGSEQTYTAKFYIMTDHLIDEESVGGEIVVATSQATGTTITLGTLDEVESTDAQAVEDGVTTHIFTSTIASINTDVTLRYEGSIDGTSYFNLDVSETDTTYTANGTYSATYIGTLKFVRVSLISETGGTAVTVVVKYLGV